MSRTEADASAPGYYAPALRPVTHALRGEDGADLPALLGDACSAAARNDGVGFHGEFFLLAGAVACLGGAAEPRALGPVLAPAFAAAGRNRRTNWRLMHLLGLAALRGEDVGRELERLLDAHAIPWEGGVILRDAEDDYSSSYHAFSTVLLALLERAVGRRGTGWAHSETLEGARGTAARLANRGRTVWLGRGQYQLFGFASLAALVDGLDPADRYRKGSILPAEVSIPSPEDVASTAAGLRRWHHGYNNAADYAAWRDLAAVLSGWWQREPAMDMPGRTEIGGALIETRGAEVRVRTAAGTAKVDRDGRPFLGHTADDPFGHGTWGRWVVQPPGPRALGGTGRLAVRLGLRAWPSPPSPRIEAFSPVWRRADGETWLLEAPRGEVALLPGRAKIDLPLLPDTDHVVIHTGAFPPGDPGTALTVEGGTGWRRLDLGGHGAVLQPVGRRLAAALEWEPGADA
jgi:hypothetical protein